MSDAKPHLRTLEEIEREGIPGLVEVLRAEGIRAVRHVLWDATGWHRDYSPPAWRTQPTGEQKRIGWEMAVRIEKILCTVLHETHERQVEENDGHARGRAGRFLQGLRSLKSLVNALLARPSGRGEAPAEAKLWSSSLSCYPLFSERRA